MERRMQKSFRESHNSITPPPQQSCPAVSIVIPLYNAEKYIGECLESVLAQTFDNYEVIVVDDCSTDNSAAIVQSYIPKFGGRLRLAHMKKNSGSGSLPRNKGLTLSEGEYIFNMDNDDTLTPTALEELYTLAKKFDADVVLTERNYKMTPNGIRTGIQIGQTGEHVKEPTLETENFPQRVTEAINLRFRVEPWCKLIRRSLLIENKIFLPDTRHGDDTIWTWVLLFTAKKFLRVPNIIYNYRLSEDSIMRVKKTPRQEVSFWFNPVILGLKNLEQMLSRIEFFRKNQNYLYALLERFIFIETRAPLGISFQLQPFEIYATIKQTFGDRLGEQDVLISALCTALNTQQKINAVNVQKFNEFAAQAQRRIAELEAQLKIK